jgi:hypothetical protein
MRQIHAVYNVVCILQCQHTSLSEITYAFPHYGNKGLNGSCTFHMMGYDNELILCFQLLTSSSIISRFLYMQHITPRYPGRISHLS